MTVNYGENAKLIFGEYTHSNGVVTKAIFADSVTFHVTGEAKQLEFANQTAIHRTHLGQLVLDADLSTTLKLYPKRMDGVSSSLSDSISAYSVQNNDGHQLHLTLAVKDPYEFSPDESHAKNLTFDLFKLPDESVHMSDYARHQLSSALVLNVDSLEEVNLVDASLAKITLNNLRYDLTLKDGILTFEYTGANKAYKQSEDVTAAEAKKEFTSTIVSNADYYITETSGTGETYTYINVAPNNAKTEGKFFNNIDLSGVILRDDAVYKFSSVQASGAGSGILIKDSVMTSAEIKAVSGNRVVSAEAGDERVSLIAGSNFTDVTFDNVAQNRIETNQDTTLMELNGSEVTLSKVTGNELVTTGGGEIYGLVNVTSGVQGLNAEFSDNTAETTSPFGQEIYGSALNNSGVITNAQVSALNNKSVIAVASDQGAVSNQFGAAVYNAGSFWLTANDQD